MERTAVVEEWGIRGRGRGQHLEEAGQSFFVAAEAKQNQSFVVVQEGIKGGVREFRSVDESVESMMDAKKEVLKK